MLWHLMLEVDRAGILEIGDGDPVEALTVLLDLPEQVVSSGLSRLLSQGVTVRHGSSLVITRFIEAQEARRSDKARARDSRERRRDEASRGVTESSRSVTPESHGVTPSHTASLSTVHGSTEQNHDQDPPTPAIVVLQEKARKILANPFDGQWQMPSKWPEVEQVGKAWSFGISLKLRDNPSSDSDLRSILEAFADGYTVDELVLAGKLAESSDHFAKLKRPGPSAFTAAVLRRLLADGNNPAKNDPFVDDGTWQA